MQVTVYTFKPKTQQKKTIEFKVRERSTGGECVQNQWELLQKKYKQKRDNRRSRVAVTNYGVFALPTKGTIGLSLGDTTILSNIAILIWN